MLGLKNIALNDDTLGTVSIPCVNRTGGATVVGNLYALDMTAADADSTTAGKALKNLLPMATAKLGFLAVIALAAVADNADVDGVIAGVTQANVNGVVTAGDKLVGVDGQGYMVTSTSGRYHAIALASNTTGTALIDVIKLEVPLAFDATASAGATLTGTETLTNKTLTSPVIASVSGNFTNTGTITPGTRLIRTVGSLVTATAAAATALTANKDVQLLVGVTGQTTYGWTLPTGVAGMTLSLINTTAFAGQLIPATGGTINGLTANAAVVIAASKCYVAQCTAADTWTVFEAAKATAA